MLVKDWERERELNELTSNCYGAAKAADEEEAKCSKPEESAFLRWWNDPSRPSTGWNPASRGFQYAEMAWKAATDRAARSDQIPLRIREPSRMREIEPCPCRDGDEND